MAASQWSTTRKIGVQHAWTHSWSNPAVTDLNGRLYVFYTGRGNEGVYYTSNDFGGNRMNGWADSILCTTSSQGTPSVVNFNNKVYVFYRPANSDHVDYCVFDGSSFSQSQLVGSDVYLSDGSSPCAVVHGGRLYLFYAGKWGTDIWYKTFDGTNWTEQVKCSASGVGIAPRTSPAGVSYKGKLYLFFNGWGNNGTFFTTLDGNSWNEVSSIRALINLSFLPESSPSVFLFSNSLVLLWNGSGKNGTWMSIFNGRTWSRQSSYSDAVNGDNLASISTAQGYSFGNSNISYRPFIILTGGDENIVVNDCPGYDLSASIDTRAWTSLLDDNQLISSLTIPGTHDSGSWCGLCVLAPTAQCQSRSIQDSLEDGIRYIDLRCDFKGLINPDTRRELGIDPDLAVSHGIVPSGQTAKEVLDSISDWLDRHPREFVIVQVREERWDSEDFAQALLDIISNKMHRWRLDNSIPTVGQLRGKIQLCKRFSRGKVPQSTSLGIEFSGSNIGWATTPILKVQDDYEPPSLEEKKASIATQCAKASSSSDQGKMFINFTSFAMSPLKGFSIETPTNNVAILHVNDWFYQTYAKLANGAKPQRLGVIMLDYFQVPEQLVPALIAHNKDVLG